MRKIILPVILSALFACNNPTEKPQEAENEIDAARQFIRASLDGRFDLARDYLLNDSLNNNYLDLAQRSYQRVSPADRESYKGATIVVHNSNSLNDSTTIVIFSNSFKNDHDTLRVLKRENKWRVDLKYLFGHDRIENTEALAPTPASTDKP